MAVLVVFWWTAGTAVAQGTAPDRILSERLCSECAITMDTVLSIPRDDLSDQLWLAVGPDGTVVGLDQVRHPGRGLLFGPDGRIAADAELGQLLVPGAPFFNQAGEILIPGERHGMVQVLTPALEPVRTFMTVEYPQAGIVLPGGTVVLNALSATAERARYALHLVSPGDDRVTSMDRSDVRFLTRSNSGELRRYPAPRDGTSFWSLHSGTYRIDLWETSGRLIESLRRDAPWFEKREPRGPAHITPPSTMLTGLAADSDGLLWVVASVADPEWVGYELPVSDQQPAEGGPHPGWNRHLQDGVFDTVLEVVDPEAGAVEVWGESVPRPFYSAIVSDGSETLIRHYTPGTSDVTEWSLLAEDGETVGRFSLDRRTRLFSLQDREVLGVGLDSLDVEHVIVGRIRDPS